MLNNAELTDGHYEMLSISSKLITTIVILYVLEAALF